MEKLLLYCIRTWICAKIPPGEDRDRAMALLDVCDRQLTEIVTRVAAIPPGEAPPNPGAFFDYRVRDFYAPCNCVEEEPPERKPKPKPGSKSLSNKRRPLN